MKKILIITAILTQYATASAQSLQLDWEMCYGPEPSNTYGGMLITDNNIYLNCFITGGGQDVRGDYGGDDTWFLKLDFNGNIIWSRCIGGTLDDGLGIQKAKDPKTLFFGGGSESTNGDLSNTVARGGQDLILGKMDTSGRVLWVKRYGGPGNDYLGKVVEDSKNFIYSDPLIYSTSGDFGTPLSFQKTHYLAKFDSLGNLLGEYSDSVGIQARNKYGFYFNGLNDYQIIGIDSNDHIYIHMWNNGIVVVDTNFRVLKGIKYTANRTWWQLLMHKTGLLCAESFGSGSNITLEFFNLDFNFNETWRQTDTSLTQLFTYRLGPFIDGKGHFNFGSFILDTAGNVYARSNMKFSDKQASAGSYGPNDWDFFTLYIYAVNRPSGDRANKVNGVCDFTQSGDVILSKYYTHGINVEEVKPTATYTLKALPHNQYAIEMGQASSFSYTVYDLLGHALAHKDLQQATTASIDLQPYANGIYILHIPGYATKKLVRIE